MHANRRRFLTSTSAAFAALSTGWVAQAFSGVPGAGTDAQALKAAWNEAKAAGRCLLVLVIPEGAGHRQAHGTAWGEVLNHGDDATRGALALTALHCASYADLRAAFGAELKLLRRPLPAAEPIALLLETDALAALPVQGKIQAIVDHQRGPRQGYAKGEPNPIRKRIEVLGLALRGALAPDEASRQRRMAQEQAAKGIPGAEQDDQSLAKTAPATLYALAHESQERLAPALRLLAAQTDERMAERIPGSKWARAGGCGTRIEGEDERGTGRLMIACGMGFVPEISQRFLAFYGA